MKVWKDFEVEVENSAHRELGIESTSRANMTIDISEVVAYYSNEDKEDIPLTSVTLRNGYSCNLFIEYRKFKNLMMEVTLK